MKKTLTFLLALVFISTSFGAATGTTTPVMAKDIMLSVGNTGKAISVKELSTISLDDFQKLTGKKMKLIDRIAFKAGQKKLRNKINDDGTISSKALQKAYKKAGGNGGGFNLAGFALGFLLGLIGVLISYLIAGDDAANRTKWAWIGAAVWIGIVLIAIII